MSNKRLWSDANSPPYSPLTAVRPRATSPGRQGSDERSADQEPDSGQALPPQISRKVKACAACRKQKIKCLMDERGPPCRRCSERNLGCVLNKSLQTIIDEKSQFADAYSHDLDMVYSSVQEVLSHLKMARMAPLKSSTGSSSRDTLVSSPSTNTILPQAQHQDSGPSCDNSPKIDPADEGLPHVPIQSLYHLTKISALRSPDASEVERRPGRKGRDAMEDFISKGAISVESAERLFRLYKDRLDHFMYSIGCRYETLDELRRKSTILTACICTVAALHDSQSDDIYGICSHEFRRLMANSMFDRLISLDSLRAMCIASYWLSDISWTTSGYAIRRAGEFNLSHSFSRVMAEGSEDAADCLRLWYILYVCDQHLATIYGRSPIVQEDFSLDKCETFLSCTAATVSDTRLVSQVSLLLIFSKIRGVFGPYTGSSISQEYLGRIQGFDYELDQWFAKWSGQIQEHNQYLGGFPRKGAILHLHFAKLYLYSHVFSGLRGSPVPLRFQNLASSAVAEAKSIINLLLTDTDLIGGLNGIPSYLHSMTAFACMFLISVSTKHGAALVDPVEVHDLITRLVKMFRSIRTGKWHLVCLMAGGLDNVLEKLLRHPTEPPHSEESSGTPAINARSVDIHNGMLTEWAAEAALGGGLDGSPFFDMNFGISPHLRFDPSVLDFGAPGQGF